MKMMSQSNPMILTPCLATKSCVICEARLFPKSAPAKLKMAKYLHQAAQYGQMAKTAMQDREASVEHASNCAKIAAHFVGLAERLAPQVTL